MTLKANLVDIMNREVYPSRIETEDGRITSIERIDETLGSYILPGFIDAHIHIESSMLIPSEFARLDCLKFFFCTGLGIVKAQHCLLLIYSPQRARSAQRISEKREKLSGLCELCG